MCTLGVLLARMPNRGCPHLQGHTRTFVPCFLSPLAGEKFHANGLGMPFINQRWLQTVVAANMQRVPGSTANTTIESINNQTACIEISVPMLLFTPAR